MSLVRMLSCIYLKHHNKLTGICGKTLHNNSLSCLARWLSCNGCQLYLQRWRYYSVLSGAHWDILTTFSQTSRILCSASAHVTSVSDPDGQFPVQRERKIGVTRREQRVLLKQKPLKLPDQRVLKVAIIGAPNAGKSTLANQLTGWKFSAVSSKVHTTRYKSLGVLTESNTQIIFLDTPGLINPMQRKKYDMEKSLLRDPHSSLYNADLILAVVDASQIWGRSHLDVELQKALHFHRNKRSVLVLNKIDVFPRENELLHAARILSEGQVSGKKDWYRAIQRDVHKKKHSLNQLYDKVSNTDDKRKAITDDMFSDDESLLETGNSDCDRYELGGNPLKHDFGSETVQAVNASGPTRSEGSKEEGDTIKSVVTNCSADEPVTTTVTSESEAENLKGSARTRNISRLDNQEEWHKYYTQEIRRVAREIGTKVGFDGFDRVFYISALEGTSVDQLKTYLLEEAYPGKWEYSGDVVTDQDPVLLAKMSVWERILDHLPKEVPYTVDLKKTLWAVDSDDLLHVEFELLVKKRYLFSVLHDNGRVIQRIAAEAKQELMNTFRREMTLRLVVKPAPKKSKKRWS